MTCPNCGAPGHTDTTGPCLKYKSFSTNTPAHNTLIAGARSNKQALINLLDSGSRDYEKMQKHLAEYASHQHAADVVSGQIKPE